MTGLCPYKNLFGSPGKGAHSYRLGGIAVVDVVLTLLVAALLSWYWDWSFGLVVTLLFVAGVILQRLFCVRTTVDRLLFS